MYEDDHNAPPFNPLPPVVILACVAIAAVELMMQGAERGFLGGPEASGWRLEAIRTYGYFDGVLGWIIENRSIPFELVIRFVTYPLIHGNFTHAAFTIVFMLAIGKMVAEVFSSLAFVLVVLLSTIFGAVAYSVFLTGEAPLFGAYPAVYGLIGALTFMLWVRAKVEGSNQIRAFSLIAALLAIQLFFKLVFGGGNDWVADIAGFMTGFLVSFLVAPGGNQRILQWLNQVRRRR